MMYRNWDGYGTSLNAYSSEWMYGLGHMGLFGFGIIAALIALALFALKGYALWHAAKRNEHKWFIALLILNSIGLLEIYYLYSRKIVFKKR